MYYSANNDEFLLPGYRKVYEANGMWPSDAVEVNDEVWQTFGLGQPPEGKQRSGGADGFPTWINIPPLSVDDLTAAAMARINAGYTQAMAAILAEYPDAETLSFDKQESQARAWDAWQEAGAVPDDEPATPYLDAMLAERPIGKAELVARILAKAAQFTAAHGQATGRRQRLEDEVKAAQAAGDRATLEAITW